MMSWFVFFFGRLKVCSWILRFCHINFLHIISIFLIKQRSFPRAALVSNKQHTPNNQMMTTWRCKYCAFIAATTFLLAIAPAAGAAEEPSNPKRSFLRQRQDLPITIPEKIFEHNAKTTTMHESSEDTGDENLDGTNDNLSNQQIGRAHV